MALFSYGGEHTAKSNGISCVDRLISWGRKPSAITLEDYLKGAAVITVGVLAGVWMFTSARAEMPVEETKPLVETVVVESTGAQARIEVAEAVVVNVDQTEALAMGIDAVISSVKGTESASDVTMVMVANTILNRTEDNRYPDTVDQVLMQPYQFSCFSESGMKWVGRAANDPVWQQRCLDAAERAMSGERMLSYGVVYVSSAKQGTVEAQLDGLYFCK